MKYSSDYTLHVSNDRYVILKWSLKIDSDDFYNVRIVCTFKILDTHVSFESADINLKILKFIF